MFNPSGTGTNAALDSPDTTGGQDVAIAFATRVGLVIVGLLIQGMLAYLLLPEGRGSYALCLVFGTLLGLFFAPGAQQGAQQFVMTGQTTVSQAVSSALTICLVGGLLASAVAIPLIHSDLAFFHKAETQSFYWGLALVPLTAFSAAVEHQLAALRRFARLAVFSLLRATTNALAMLLFVWGWGLGVDGALAAFATGPLVMIAACLWYLRRHCGLVLTFPPSRSCFTRILHYGWRYHLARIGGGIGPQLGIVLLGVIASGADIGLFAAANSIIFGFCVISNSVSNAMLPRIAGRERHELAARCLRLVCGGTALPILCLLAVSEPLVRLLLSEAFLPITPLLWIMALGSLASATANMLMTYFQGIDRPGICSWAVCLGLCVNVGALFWLFPFMGVQGAAWALTIGMVCQCLFLTVVFSRLTGMSWRAVWLPRSGDATYLRESVWAVWERGAEKRVAP